MAEARRDPVSETLDGAARLLLERVYRANGGWASTRLRDPSPAQLSRWLAEGINVLGKDTAGRGGFRVPNAWCRSFVRAVWYQHKWFSGEPNGGGWRTERRAAPRHPGVQIHFGRHAATLGVIPAGYPVRVRLADVAAAQASGRPESEWRWADKGPRWANPADRNWPAFR